jgi:hypothetical protein
MPRGRASKVDASKCDEKEGLQFAPAFLYRSLWCIQLWQQPLNPVVGFSLQWLAARGLLKVKWPKHARDHEVFYTTTVYAVEVCVMCSSARMHTEVWQSEKLSTGGL